MYSKLHQVLPNLPKKYEWYVQDYLEKKCSHDDCQTLSGEPGVMPFTMSANCASCNFYSSLRKNATDESSGVQSRTQTSASSQSSKACIEIGGMVDDFIEMLYKEFCYEDDTIGYTIEERIAISLENYYAICDEQGPEEALKTIMALTATNTLHLFSPQTRCKDSTPKDRDPRFSDIIHMDEERINKALIVFVAIANQENGLAVLPTASMILADYDVTVFALFFSELFHCMSCADPRKNVSAYQLNGPQLLFRRLEKHGYRNTLEWAIKEIENFSIMIDKLAEKLYLFDNLKHCKKQEIKTILQIIFKYHGNYSEVKRETDQILSVNPLFMPIFAIIQFKKSMASGK